MYFLKSDIAWKSCMFLIFLFIGNAFISCSDDDVDNPIKGDHWMIVEDVVSLETGDEMAINPILAVRKLKTWNIYGHLPIRKY